MGVWPCRTAVVSPCHLPDSQHLAEGKRGCPSQGPAFSFGGSKLEAFPLLMGILQLLSPAPPPPQDNDILKGTLVCPHGLGAAVGTAWSHSCPMSMGATVPMGAPGPLQLWRQHRATGACRGQPAPSRQAQGGQSPAVSLNAPLCARQRGGRAWLSLGWGTLLGWGVWAVAG